MEKYERWILWIALIVAVAAIGIALYRSFNLDWDAIMFAMAMLSALVVLLIGWNIYTLFDFKEMKDEVAKERNSAFKESEESLAIAFIALSDFYYAVWKGVDPKEQSYNYVYSRVAAIYHASRIDRIELCKEVIEESIAVLSKESISMSADNKEYIIKLLSSSKKGSSIKGFDNLLLLLAMVKEE